MLTLGVACAILGILFRVKNIHKGESKLLEMEIARGLLSILGLITGVEEFDG
jgi:hypothetical protein